MVNLKTYYSFANIRKGNNSFKWSIDGGGGGGGETCTLLHIPTGCYELKAINGEITSIRGNSDITILPNVNTLQCILTVVGAKCKVSFDAPWQKIFEAPQNLIYLPVTKDVISTLSVWLTDQDGELLDLRGEKLTIRFHLREC